MILFLDFDGVLTNQNDSKPNIDRFGYGFNEDWVNNFNYLIHLYPQIKVVISSNWQGMFRTIEDAKECLINRGVKCTLHSEYKTRLYQRDTLIRGQQIQNWLENNDYTNFIILDDDMSEQFYVHKDNIIDVKDKGFNTINFIETITKINSIYG